MITVALCVSAILTARPEHLEISPLITPEFCVLEFQYTALAAWHCYRPRGPRIYVVSSSSPRY